MILMFLFFSSLQPKILKILFSFAKVKIRDTDGITYDNINSISDYIGAEICEILYFILELKYVRFFLFPMR